MIDASAEGEVPDPIPRCPIAYLQYTSGSTSSPRGVVVTHANLIDNITMAADAHEVDAASTIVSWLPLTHDMGLIVAALPAVALGCRSVLLPPAAFVRRPVDWLRLFDARRGTHTYAPNFAYDLCVDRSAAEDRATLDLRSVRMLLNGAEPVRLRTRDRFLEVFGPCGLDPEAWTPAYGLAEATVYVSGRRGCDEVLWVDPAALEQHRVVEVSRTTPRARALCSAGPPGATWDVRIVDPDTDLQAGPGVVGEIWLAGPSVTAGYWRDPAPTAEVFEGRLADDEASGRFLRTGDLGFMHGESLVITGRRKDVIIVRGRNVYPHDLELAAELAHPAIRAGGTAAFGVETDDGESVVVLVELDDPAVAAAVSTAVRRADPCRVRGGGGGGRHPPSPWGSQDLEREGAALRLSRSLAVRTP